MLRLIDTFQEFYDWLFHGTEKEPIDLDNVWQLLGYKNKGLLVMCLKRFYKENEDYFALGKAKYSLGFGCFQDFCIKAPTKLGKYIRTRIISTEEAAREYMEEMERQEFVKEGILPFPKIYQNPIQEAVLWVKSIMDGSLVKKMDRYLPIEREIG